MKSLYMKLLVSLSIALFLFFPLIVQSVDQGTIKRIILLTATESAPSEYAEGMVMISQAPQDRDREWMFFDANITNLRCRGITFFEYNRDTAPFEVYLLKINEEPIVSFNTRCVYSPRIDDVGGEFTTRIIIQGNEFLSGWLDDPRYDPIHAEVYLESPMSDPPTSTLVLEGWLFD